MYEQHPAFLEPNSPDAIIWRYMDLPKLLSIVHSGGLYFARGDRFGDPYEGMLTDSMARNLRSSSERTLRMWHQHHINTRFDTYLNCWHLGEHESAAMWKIYGSSGIALQSTFAALVESISATSEPIMIGRVRYGDEHLQGDTMPNGLASWLTKRWSFEHEKELRAVIWRPRNFVVGTAVKKKGEGWKQVGDPIVANPDTPLAITIDVKLDALIQRIVLAPDTDDWTVQLLKGVIEKYGLSLPVRRSRLYESSLLET